MPEGQQIQLSINGRQAYFFKAGEMKKAERLKKLLLNKRYHEVKLMEAEDKIERFLRPWAYR
jgi:hypothetical protein